MQWVSADIVWRKDNYNVYALKIANVIAKSLWCNTCGVEQHNDRYATIVDNKVLSSRQRMQIQQFIYEKQQQSPKVSHDGWVVAMFTHKGFLYRQQENTTVVMHFQALLSPALFSEPHKCYKFCPALYLLTYDHNSSWQWNTKNRFV